MSIPYEENVARSAVWLRHLAFGPTGAGKSKGALRLATALFEGELPVTLINTEIGRGKLYADRFPLAGYIGLDTVGNFDPATTMVQAIDLAEKKQPGGVIVLDSISHEWMGTNGVLQQADRFGDWKTVRPKHNEFVQRLLACECHVIATCRANMKYDVTEEPRPNGNGNRQVVRALGVGPVQSNDLQYEFNLIGQYELATHEVMFSGHVDPLIDTVHNLDDDADLADVAAKLERWLSDGAPILPPPTAEDEQVTELVELLHAEGVTDEVIADSFDKMRRRNRGQLHPDTIAEKIKAAKERAEAKAPAPAAA